MKVLPGARGEWWCECGAEMVDGEPIPPVQQEPDVRPERGPYLSLSWQGGRPPGGGSKRSRHASPQKAKLQNWIRKHAGERRRASITPKPKPRRPT